MLKFGLAYLGSSIALLCLDFVWLNLAAPRFYRPRIGALLLESPNLVVAGVFYLVYAAGVVVLAVLPSAGERSPVLALGLGAVLGLVAYGTYDFTNLATLKGWSGSVTAVDVTWGIIVSAASAGAGYWLLRSFSPS